MKHWTCIKRVCMGEATGCPFCGTGCGLIATHTPKGYAITGDKNNPSTRGELCFKPVQMAKALDVARLQTPLYRRSKQEPFEAIGWEEAIDRLAQQLRTRSSKRVYAYLSGQLLSEESYLFTKLWKGFLGTNNMDANSRLCMASAVVAHKMLLGSDGPMGGYGDIDDADVILISGANPAWAHPVIFKRILQRKKDAPHTQIITLDPMYSESAQKSDHWMALHSGSDTLLYGALLGELDRLGALDRSFIDEHTDGFEALRQSVAGLDFETVLGQCGLSRPQGALLVECFASDRKIIGLWCQGLNQATDGVMRNISFMSLFLATGRIHPQKGFALSLTGQPNAMGGREVGYLSNALPGYRDVRNPLDRRACEIYWDRPEGTIDAQVGITITEAITQILEHQMDLIWIVCTNPLLSLPDVERTHEALTQEELFVVVQDCTMSHTAQLANLVLPTHGWGEKEGSMTNSERFIKRVRPFKPAPDGTKSDSDIIAAIGRALGYDGFDFESVEAIYDEYKGLTQGRLCDQSACDYATLSYQWGGAWLYHAHHVPRVTFHPLVLASMEHDGFVLLTGRTKKHWHTMTRTAHASALCKGEEEPYLLMNPDEASALGMVEGESIEVCATHAKVVLPIRFGRLAPHHLYAPFGYAVSAINRLIQTHNDPFSGQSALKSTRVHLRKIDPLGD